MSIQSLCSIHTISVRPRTAVTDEFGSTYESQGDIERYLKCRVVPVSEKEMIHYQQLNMRATHKFLFASDPQLNNNDTVVFKGRAFRIDSVHNAHELDRYFTCTGFHDPQIEA